MKLISVIVPVYNAQRTIKRCISSILEQSYSNLEIIIINDGSSDDSLSICQTFQDQRIQLIDKKNGGVSHTRNTGLKAAHGEYVIFIDADDYLSKDYVACLYRAMEKNPCDLVVSNYCILSGDGLRKNESIKEYTCADKHVCVYDIYTKAMLNQPWNKLYCRQKIKNLFRENMSLGEDLFFNLDYIKNIQSVTVINEFGYTYDIQMGGLHKNKQSISEFFSLYQYMFESISIKNKYQMDLFIVKHYIRYLYDNRMPLKKEYYTYLKNFRAENKRSRWMMNEIVWFTLGKGYYFVRKH